MNQVAKYQFLVTKKKKKKVIMDKPMTISVWFTYFHSVV